ncbi:hypothetical protein [Aurantimonas sp. Leaf443]|uniref:hypothetical protein n=1 Tax=Aurantimonas sp. Leaf443 TaxID=1736378 RepID=UPI000701FDF5|nr:hypothetical protein [Aurantimonas sp. Leaf443]KQT88161.1 hypothetical protein ASG48_01570 [Aurantimonas sp. Leaf443]
MTIQDEEDAPLDPATERLRRKMLRLLALSVGTLILGVMAVLAAIVYKSSAPDLPAAGAPPLALALPQGAQVLESALDGDRALLRLSLDGRQALYLVALSDGAILARYDLGEIR